MTTRTRSPIANDSSRDCSFRGIFHLLGIIDDHLYRERADLPGVLVEFGPQVFLGLVVLARGHNNGVFNRADYNLRVNTLFPAQGIDSVVELARHINDSNSCYGTDC